MNKKLKNSKIGKKLWKNFSYNNQKKTNVSSV